MKKILVPILFTLVSQVALSEPMKLPEGSEALYLVEGELTGVSLLKPRCSPEVGNNKRRCRPKSFADITVTLSGCVDSLGPVTYNKQVDAESGDVTVYVTALAIQNEASKQVKCFAQPGAAFSLPLGFGEKTKDQVNVVFAKEMVKHSKKQ